MSRNLIARIRTLVFSQRSAAIAVLFVFAALIGKQIIYGTASNWKRDPYKALVDAVGSSRPLEARLTGGFAHGPCRFHSLINKDSNHVPGDLLKIDFESILPLKKEDHSELEPRFMALSMILSGKFDEAIDVLETETTSTERTDARILSDLTAAYFSRGKRQNSFADLIHALSLVEQAVSIDPSLAEAQFNRALILEKISLFDAARSAWNDYLKINPSGLWADEARQHLARLSEPTIDQIWRLEKQKLVSAAMEDDKKTVAEIVRRFPHFSRTFAIEETLPKWANEYSVGHQIEAKKYIKIARAIAAALPIDQDGRFTADAVSAVDAASEDNLKILAEAYKDLNYGLQLFSAGKVDEAVRRFKRADRFFSLTGETAVETYAALLWAIPERDFNRAYSELARIRSIAEARNYPYILGRTWRALASFQGYQFRVNDALDSLRNALKYLNQIGDLENIAMVNFIMADILSQIKETERISNYQFESLANLGSLSDSRYRDRILTGIAVQLQLLGEMRAARSFHNISVAQAVKKADGISTVLALLRRSQINDQIGERQAALSDLSDAKSLIDSMTDPVTRTLFQEEHSIISGEYMLKDDPAGAIKIFTGLLEKFRSFGDKYYTVRLYRSRAEALLLLGDRINAERDLETAIREFESNRDKIAVSAHRIDFFKEAAPLYDEMIALQMAKNRVEDAFNYAERAKARVLLDAIEIPNGSMNINAQKPSYASPFSAPASALLRNQLPEGVNVVEYAVLKDKTFVWAADRHKNRAVELPVGAEELKLLAVDLRSAMENRKRTEELKRLSSKLYDAIFRPISGLLTDGSEIVIVPDKTLHIIPFAALFDSNARRFLVEDRVISYAPSATVFMRCLERNRTKSPQKKAGILIVADPTFDQSRFSELKRLRWAEFEAKSIKDVYEEERLKGWNGGSEILIRDAATKEAFNEAIDHYEIMHFAGHAVENRNSPLFSHLVLASANKADPNDGSLYAYEIYGRRLENTRLVILSACRAANGKQKPGEGMMSLARAFLAAGAPTVLAGLWNLDDRTASQISITFHRRLLAGDGPAAALSAAQRELLHSPEMVLNSPSIWGSFMVIGCGTRPGLFR